QFSFRPQRQTSRKRPVLLGVAALLVVGIVLGIFAISKKVAFGKEKTTASTAAAVSELTTRADGLPNTLRELNTWYAEPAQNGAPFFLHGLEALKFDNLGSTGLPLVGRGKLPLLGNALPPAMKSPVAALIRDSQEG